MKWISCTTVFHLIRDYVNRPVMKKGLVVMGSQDHIFFRSAKRFTELQKTCASP